MTKKNKYWAVVDKNGTKHVFKNRPLRCYNGWVANWGDYISHANMENFPKITWQDEPVEVRLMIKEVKK